ncbi:MAG: tetratricopeptide repeat protein [Melioribacter sp.]|uniref:tetratricopeptide repeat protein n=1 Tax=Rosettibacter primus TaxID=3111523 RepID=UPI00247EC21E|nr:tetratricopeptide repeat protein [Melioribacter sp.]
MRIKSLYIYVIIFTAFIISLIIFSPSAKEPTLQTQINPHGQMPDDDIHRGMSQNTEDMPSKSNVAKEALEQLNQLKEDYEKNPEDTVKIRNYADMLTLAHQHDKAIELYEKILKVDSKRIDILQHLTFLYFNKGELDKAEEMSKKILTIKKDYPLALYNLGVISHIKGDNQKAKYYWNEVLKKEPDSKLAKNAKELLQNLEKIKK